MNRQALSAGGLTSWTPIPGRTVLLHMLTTNNPLYGVSAMLYQASQPASASRRFSDVDSAILWAQEVTGGLCPIELAGNVN